MELTLRQDDLEKLHYAKQILEADFKSHYTISELAQKVGLNECKLKYGFKELFNAAPYKFLTGLRIEKAKELLEVTEHPLKRISLSVGISNVSTFIRVFKRITGFCPDDWRRSV